MPKNKVTNANEQVKSSSHDINAVKHHYRNAN